MLFKARVRSMSISTKSNSMSITNKETACNFIYYYLKANKSTICNCM